MNTPPVNHSEDILLIISNAILSLCRIWSITMFSSKYTVKRKLMSDCRGYLKVVFITQPTMGDTGLQLTWWITSAGIMCKCSCRRSITKLELYIYSSLVSNYCSSPTLSHQLTHHMKSSYRISNHNLSPPCNHANAVSLWKLPAFCKTPLGMMGRVGSLLS